MTNYKQTDERWASYPYAGEDMYHAGCGPTAVADLLDKLPTEIADWMTANGAASDGSGTEHFGIYACLQAYGYESSKLTDYSRAGVISDPTFETFKERIKAGYCGVLLMGGRGSGCINSYWSNYGHYIAVVGYDSATDQYQVYDPAYHPRDGWHPWSDLSGCIKHVYTSSVRWKAAARPAAKKVTVKAAAVTTYRFSVQQIRLGSTDGSVLLAQYILSSRGLYTGKFDKSFGPQMEKAAKAYQKARGLKQDGIIGPATWKDMLALEQDADGKCIAHQIRKGDTAAEVYLLKEILKAMGRYKKGLNFKFDDTLETALKARQKAEKLVQDGICGPATWKNLISL